MTRPSIYLNKGSNCFFQGKVTYVMTGPRHFCVCQACLGYGLVPYSPITQQITLLKTVQPITDADYADDLPFVANTTVQAKSQLHSLEQAARGIGLYVNSDITVYFFNQDGAISS